MYFMFQKLKILLNKRFTKQSFSEKTNEIDVKLTIILGKNDIIFLWTIEKNWSNSTTMNEGDEKNIRAHVPISTPNPPLAHLYS